MKKKLLLIFSVVAILLNLTACSTTKSGSNTESDTSSTQSTTLANESNVPETESQEEISEVFSKENSETNSEDNSVVISEEKSESETQTTTTENKSHDIPEKETSAPTTPYSFTNLEFWITENVEHVDFSQYNHAPFFNFMANIYYGKNYASVKNEDGHDDYPEHYVLYYVSAYPDYSDGGSYVTSIEITDPNITLYGLTINDEFEKFETVLGMIGYTTTIEDKGDYKVLIAENADGINFYLYDKYQFTDRPLLIIDVEVTNKYDVLF